MTDSKRRDADQLRLGVDIGGTKIHAVALDGAGSIIAEGRRATGFGTHEVVENSFIAIADLGRKLGVEAIGFSSIGVGIPGLVNTATGHVSHAVNLGLESVDFGVLLGERLGRAVTVENDVNVAALGAFELLSGRGIQSLAYLNLGTGLAAGLVLDGRIWRGSRGVAGEIGHIPIDPAGERCRCGQRGCLETLASGSALAQVWPHRISSPGGDLFIAADNGDELAAQVAERLVGNVGAAVRILMLTVDIDVVVIGGGLSSLGDRLLGQVRARLIADARTSLFLSSLDIADRVVMLPAGSPVAAVGAALAAQPETAKVAL